MRNEPNLNCVLVPCEPKTQFGMGEDYASKPSRLDGHFAQRAHWPKNGELDLRNEANQKFEEALQLAKRTQLTLEHRFAECLHPAG